MDATITLFQLFTLDQWYRIYNDLIKVIHPAFACTYILLWVWIGAFLFRNLFVGIMGEPVNVYSRHQYSYLYRRLLALVIITTI